MALVSAFTATHADYVPYILKLYGTLLEQTHTEWEWVILTNNGAEIPPSVTADGRVKVIHDDGEFSEDAPKIGYIKSKAAAGCSGDILVELDADDLLMPNCFEEVAKAMEPGVHFVYSNWAEFFSDNWESYCYQGWNPTPFTYKGHELQALHPQGTNNAIAFAYIGTCPNHVRAWSRDGYWRIGGFDPEMDLSEDYDIIVRSYIAFGQAGIRYIDKCLYLYRRHRDGGTYNRCVKGALERSNKIYAQKKELIASRWAKDNGLQCVDLVGPSNTPDGYTPVEYMNVEEFYSGRWPFPDGSIGALRAHYVFEHFNQLHAMRELYRVLAPGAWAFLRVPSWKSSTAYRDPTNCSIWTTDSVFYFTKPEYIRKIKHAFTGQFANRLTYEATINGNLEIHMDLIKP